MAKNQETIETKITGYAVRNDGLGWRCCDQGDETSNETFTLTQPLPREPTIQEQFDSAVNAVRVALQNKIDEKARSLGFSEGNALMLYAGFDNAFQSLAITFATWECSVWVEADAYKAKVIAGTKPMLSGAEAVVMMPDYPEN